MIVCFRMEVSDKERSALSLRTHPKALKRLATGAEMKQLLADLWDANIVGQDSEENKVVPYSPFDDAPLVFVEKSPAQPIEAPNAQKIMEKPAVYTDSGIKLKPEPVAPVIIEPEKGITGLRKLIHHVNCAMFSLSMARRMSPEHSVAGQHQLDSLCDNVELLRGDLALEHDEAIED